MPIQNNRKRGFPQRDGAASLELVLALPVLLAMLVAMVWLGFAVIGQAEVTAQARQDAWTQRLEPWTNTAFTFSDDQQVTGEATTTVNVSPLLDDLADPESEHTLEQANWDHRSVDYQSMPNWELYADVAVAAKREGILSMYEDARALFNSASGDGSSALNAIELLIAQLRQSESQIDSAGNSAQQNAELEEQLQEEDRRGQIQKLENEIADQEREIERLENSEDDDAKDRLWLAKKILKRLEISLKLVEAS